MWSVKGRKEGKDEELNREAIRPFGQREKEWGPKVWGLSAAWVRASKKWREK